MVADGTGSGGGRFDIRQDRRRLRAVGLIVGRGCAGLLGALLVMQSTSGVAQISERSRAPWPERRIEAPSRENVSDRVGVGQDETGATDRQRSAAGILADASEALRQGDVMLARRRLEVLIETYPETPAAELARHRLVALFGGTGGARSVRSLETEPSGARRGYLPVESGNTAERGQSRRDAAGIESLPANAVQVQPRDRRPSQDDRRVQMLGLEFQSAAGDRVFFAETRSDLGARARTVIANQARWLSRHGDLPVVIEAHADDHRTNQERDTELSQKRAEAVADLLVDHGVARDRIVIHAFGRDRPIATCQAPECAAQNRRVVVRVGRSEDGNASRRGPDEPALATVPGRSLRTPSN